MNLLVDAELCRLIHDLQGHTIHVAGVEKTASSKARATKVVAPSSAGSWAHIDCCGLLKPYYIVAINELWNEEPFVSMVFFSKNIYKFGNLLKHTDDIYKVENNFMSTGTILKKKGAYAIYESTVGAKAWSLGERVWDGGFGEYRNMDGNIKSFSRLHLKSYNTPIVMSQLKTYHVYVWASLLPTLPSFDFEEEDIHHWLDMTIMDYQDGALPVWNSAKPKQYGGLDLMPINLSDVRMHHNELLCSICETLTPMFHESEDGAIRVLKGVGMG